MHHLRSVLRRVRPLQACFLATLCLAGAGMATAQGQPPAAGAKAEKVAARVAEVRGALLQQKDKGANTWHAVQANDPLTTGRLLVAVPEADIVSVNGTTGMRMLADVTDRLPEPLFESAVTLNPNPAGNLDVTLDRGIIALANLRPKGDAKATVRFLDQKWDIDLLEPGTRVIIMLYGRHAPGLRGYIRDPKKLFQGDQAPTIDVYLLVVNGKITLKDGRHTHAMQAPPGLAHFHWDNVVGHDEQLEHLQELPEAAKPRTPEELKQASAIFDRCKVLNQKPVPGVFPELLKSSNETDRALAIVLFGALDMLPQLVDALGSKNEADRDLAAIILRHWLGRTTGQDQKLYDYLTKNKDFKDNEAKTLLQLLYGAKEDERRNPEVFDVLLALLRHDEQPIRELAHWHLYRLVPEGKNIPYDSTGTPEQHKEAYKKWKELIPDGELPPGLKRKG